MRAVSQAPLCSAGKCVEKKAGRRTGIVRRGVRRQENVRPAVPIEVGDGCANEVASGVKAWQVKPLFEALALEVTQRDAGLQALGIETAVHQHQVSPAVHVQVGGNHLHGAVRAVQADATCDLFETAVPPVSKQPGGVPVRSITGLDQTTGYFLEGRVSRYEKIRMAVVVIVEENRAHALAADSLQAGLPGCVQEPAVSTVSEQHCVLPPEQDKKVGSSVAVHIAHGAIDRRLRARQACHRSLFGETAARIAEETD